jgi:hypothetical protein
MAPISPSGPCYMLHDLIFIARNKDVESLMIQLEAKNKQAPVKRRDEQNILKIDNDIDFKHFPLDANEVVGTTQQTTLEQHLGIHRPCGFKNGSNSWLYVSLKTEFETNNHLGFAFIDVQLASSSSLWLLAFLFSSCNESNSVFIGARISILS